MFNRLFKKEKMYKSEIFFMKESLTKFLNKENIKKEQIIEILYDGKYFNLFYID